MLSEKTVPMEFLFGNAFSPRAEKENFEIFQLKIRMWGARVIIIKRSKLSRIQPICCFFNLVSH